MQQLDSLTVKQQQEQEWNRVAPGWKKYDERLREASRPVTSRLLELAGIRSGYRVLDVASGTGEPGLPAAEIAGPSGFVLLTDAAADMLQVAKEKTRARGLTNVGFQVADGETLEAGENEFDAALCRFGMMFMPEPVRCLRTVHRALKPGGRFAVAVWGPPQLNPFVTVTIATLRKYVDVPPPVPGAVGIFAFADRNRLASVFSEAGYRDIQLEEMQITAANGESGYDYFQYISEIAGPVASLLGTLSDEDRAKVREEIAAQAGGGDPNANVQLAGAPIVAVGTK